MNATFPSIPTPRVSTLIDGAIPFPTLHLILLARRLERELTTCRQSEIFLRSQVRALQSRIAEYKDKEDDDDDDDDNSQSNPQRIAQINLLADRLLALPASSLGGPDRDEIERILSLIFPGSEHLEHLETLLTQRQTEANFRNEPLP